MKRLAISLLACSLFLGAGVQSGCGGDEPEPANPNQVLNRAFAQPASGEGAEVEVASLGLEDQTLKARTLSLNPATYAAIREAIGSPQRGLEAVVVDIETEGTEDLDGVEVNHVSGLLDVDGLVDSLIKASDAGAALEEEGAGLPGVGELEQLKETLVEGRFDLFARTDDGGFERLDLTLSLDDRENALPPTRIRFSLTETDPGEGSS